MITLRSKYNGFSLLEIIIVLALMGILTTLCLPLYSHFITQAKRFEAEMQLTHLAALLEQYDTVHHSYEEATLNNLGISEYVADHHYQLVLQTQTSTFFNIIAKPVGNQAKNDIKCGSLTLNALGEKGMTGTGSLSDCWTT